MIASNFALSEPAAMSFSVMPVKGTRYLSNTHRVQWRLRLAQRGGELRLRHRPNDGTRRGRIARDSRDVHAEQQRQRVGRDIVRPLRRAPGIFAQVRVPLALEQRLRE